MIHMLERLPDVERRAELAEFVCSAFDSLPRADQRRWAAFYVNGLLTVPRRKSIRNMADGHLVDSTVQSLQQFVNQSPWDWSPIRGKLIDFVAEKASPQAWILDRMVIPKRGAHSVGVARRFIPEQGRTMNSQLGAGLFLAGAGYSVPVDWSIVLSGKWATDEGWRAKSRVPGEVVGADEAGTMLGLVGTHLPAETGRLPGILLADFCGNPAATQLVPALARRGTPFLVQVDEAQEAVGMPRPMTRPARHAEHQHSRTTVGELFRMLGRQRALSPLRGTDDACTLVLSALVRLPTRMPAGDGPRPYVTQRLVVEWPVCENETVRYWLTNLGHDRLAELPGFISLLRGHRSELAALRNDFGVLDFEGRSFPGWHHHMTLVSAAFTYDRLARRGTPGVVRRREISRIGPECGGEPVTLAG
ncbi:hypothetical protein OK074_5251 [Actinobacteria bacterium OK074]|nr:hypothetical protein OK074_5251 [Actinobacteria bacterium OK074]